jgi:hypothetical protein
MPDTEGHGAIISSDRPLYRGNSVKVAFAIVIGLVAVGSLVGAYLLGQAIGLRRNYNNRLRDLGLHRRSAELYARAAKILNRLAALTDLDGTLAGDILSPETKQQVSNWLTDHRREIDKV